MTSDAETKNIMNTFLHGEDSNSSFLDLSNSSLSYGCFHSSNLDRLDLPPKASTYIPCSSQYPMKGNTEHTLDLTLSYTMGPNDDPLNASCESFSDEVKNESKHSDASSSTYAYGKTTTADLENNESSSDSFSNPGAEKQLQESKSTTTAKTEDVPTQNKCKNDKRVTKGREVKDEEAPAHGIVARTAGLIGNSWHPTNRYDDVKTKDLRCTSSHIVYQQTKALNSASDQHTTKEKIEVKACKVAAIKNIWLEKDKAVLSSSTHATNQSFAKFTTRSSVPAKCPPQTIADTEAAAVSQDFRKYSRRASVSTGMSSPVYQPYSSRGPDASASISAPTPSATVSTPRLTKPSINECSHDIYGYNNTTNSPTKPSVSAKAGTTAAQTTTLNTPVYLQPSAPAKRFTRRASIATSSFIVPPVTSRPEFPTRSAARTTAKAYAPANPSPAATCTADPSVSSKAADTEASSIITKVTSLSYTPQPPTTKRPVQTPSMGKTFMEKSIPTKSTTAASITAPPTSPTKHSAPGEAESTTRISTATLVCQAQARSNPRSRYGRRASIATTPYSAMPTASTGLASWTHNASTTESSTSPSPAVVSPPEPTKSIATSSASDSPTNHSVPAGAESVTGMATTASVTQPSTNPRSRYGRRASIATSPYSAMPTTSTVQKASWTQNASTTESRQSSSSSAAEVSPPEPAPLKQFTRKPFMTGTTATTTTNTTSACDTSTSTAPQTNSSMTKYDLPASVAYTAPITTSHVTGCSNSTTTDYGYSQPTTEPTVNLMEKNDYGSGDFGGGGGGVNRRRTCRRSSIACCVNPERELIRNDADDFNFGMKSCLVPNADEQINAILARRGPAKAAIKLEGSISLKDRMKAFR